VGFFFAGGECGPGGQPHKWRHLPSVHGDLDVGTWSGDFKYAFTFIETAFQACELFDLRSVDSGLGKHCGGSEQEGDG